MQVVLNVFSAKMNVIFNTCPNCYEELSPRLLLKTVISNFNFYPVRLINWFINLTYLLWIQTADNIFQSSAWEWTRGCFLFGGNGCHQHVLIRQYPNSHKSNSLRYVLERVVISFQVRWKWIKVKIWHEWGLKVDGHYKMTTKRFQTYYLFNQLLQMNFLEKNFRENFVETAEKYFLRQLWDRYFKDWFRPQTMTKPFRIFNSMYQFLEFIFG